MTPQHQQPRFPLYLDHVLRGAGIQHYGVDRDGEQFTVTTFNGGPFEVCNALSENKFAVRELGFDKRPDSLCWDIFFTLGDYDEH